MLRKLLRNRFYLLNMAGKKKFFIISVPLILVLGAGFFIWFDLNKSNESNGSGGSDFVKPADMKMPDLSRPIVITADFPEDAKEIAKKNIEDTIVELKTDNTLFNSWMRLGVLRKAIGDYEGAKEVWEFAGALAPKNSASFNNLGDLYWHYLPDFKKAEENFLKAIENDPAKTFIYINLSEFYSLSYKEKFDMADDILLKGLENNPSDLNLLKVLADYYKNSGNKNKAGEYYNLILGIYPGEVWAKKELQDL